MVTSGPILDSPEEPRKILMSVAIPWGLLLSFLSFIAGILFTFTLLRG